MALSTYPAVSSPVKSVQRGSAAGAGTVTITSIDIAKSMVNIQGTIGSGTASASFGLSAASTGNAVIRGTGITYNNHSSANNVSRRPNGSNAFANTSTSTLIAGGGSNYNYQHITWEYSAPVNAFGYNVNAGSNNLVAGQVQGYLSNATSLVVSGACRYEVVEYN